MPSRRSQSQAIYEEPDRDDPPSLISLIILLTVSVTLSSFHLRVVVSRIHVF